MNKNCFIYETLNGVKDMQVARHDGFMTLSGVFGVCGVRNNNSRVYETANYSKMVSEMQGRIKDEGGIPGELEHPNMMNITLENVSHKITDINIDENGVVTGSITLLDTPKGKIAQAIVEGGLPLFISSRATGNIDKDGNVLLEKIATYDLVGTPGFSQAKLKLNENQVAGQVCESIYYIAEKENNEENNNIEDMESKELLERLEALESRISDLEETNESLREQLEESQDKGNIKEWIIEEYSPAIEKWIVEEYSTELNNWITEDVMSEIQSSNKKLIKESIKDTLVNKFAPKLQEWIINEYSPVVENWCKTELADGIEKWIVEEYSEGVNQWLNESYVEKVNETVAEKIEESHKDNLDSIGNILNVLESVEPQKPTYSRATAVVNENLSDEPMYIQKMPANLRPKWEMASDEVKESIYRRSKLYNLVNEGEIARFWNNVNFENIRPAQTVYEGLETIEDVKEKAIRQAFRRHKRFI